MTIARWFFALMLAMLAPAAMNLAPPAFAAYPERPIRIIVPVAPGGLADAMARAAAARLQSAFGREVVVENKAGANFQLAATAVTTAPPDGYTLLLANDGPIVINPHLYAKLSYDPFKDLVAVSGIARADQVFFVHPAMPAKTMDDLVALARAKPGEITFAGFGLGSTTHLYMEMLQVGAGVKFQPIQYKGAAPMVADVVAGHVNASSVSLGQALPLHQEGKVRIVGVATRTRNALLPDVPAVAETVPDFEAKSWFGLFAPAGTPADVVDRLHAEIQKMCADPAFLDKVLGPYRMTPLVGSQRDFVDFLKAESATWKGVIDGAGLKIVE